MKRIHIATLGLTLAAASIAVPAFAQAPAGSTDFSPTPPVYTPADATSAPPDAAAAPAYAAPQASAPVVEESSITAQPMELAPVLPAPAAQPGETRRAAPEAPPAAARHDPNEKTGQFLGHGLFDNWGPNDFGA